jgi:hypothetical protein
MKRICYIATLFYSIMVVAQPPKKFFTTFGGEGVDIGYKVKEIYNRQYIIAGSTTSYGAGSSDAYIILADSMGQIVWQKTYGSVFADVARSVIFNPIDSGFVFAGFTASYGNGGYDVYVVRIDKKGDLIWQSAVGGLDWEFAYDLVWCSDGNIIVCGKTFSEGRGKSDGYVLKINSTNGALMWKRTYGGTEDDNFVSILVSTEGNYTMAGNTKSYGDINNDFWLFKINTNGDSCLAVNLANPNKAEYCYDMVQDPLGDFVLCGSYDTSAVNSGKNISYIVKADNNGNFIDDFKLPGAGTPDDKFVSVVNSTNNMSYFFTRKVQNGTLGIDFQPVLYDHHYNYLNTGTYGDFNNDEPYGSCSTSDNGLVMIGSTRSFNSVGENIFFVKIDYSVLSAYSIVGINEKTTHEISSEMYYHGGVIYLSNPKGEGFNFQIINSTGQIVQNGTINNNHIEVSSQIECGVYTVKVFGEKYLITKFIKE